MVSEYTKKSRIAQLKRMHEIMMNMNHEDAYHRWIICGVPDCPEEEDFESFAENDEEYMEVCMLFISIFSEFYDEE